MIIKGGIGAAPKKLIAAACALIMIAAVCLLAPGYYGFLIGTIATTALVGVGLNILVGLAGEVSLGQAGFLSVGAYVVAIIGSATGFWGALPLAVLLSGAIGALLSVPALRVTGPYLAMVTIAFGFIEESATVEWVGLTGGSSGIAEIAQPFGTGGTALLASTVCAAALFGFDVLKRSPIGLAMLTGASAPAVARSLGISLLPVRVAAFVLAAATAGLAGALQAGLTGFVAPSSFPFSQSILILLVVMVGGAGRTLGPLYGAVAVGLIPEVLSSLAEYRLLVFGVALLLVLRLAPDGIAGLVAPLVARLRRRHSNDALPASAPKFGRQSAGGLSARGLGVSFHGVNAVAGVDLDAEPGAVTSLIGPNGAGKTTLLNLLSGFVAADAGIVSLGGASVGGLPAHRRARAGIARTFQTAQAVEGLSLLDNVRLGLLRGRWRGTASEEDAHALLHFVGLAGSSMRQAGTLPHVDRRLLEIARALAMNPRVLLLDEPAAGLDAADTVRLGTLLRQIADAGLAVVLVEHDMSLVMTVSDTVVVLDAGRRIAAGKPADVRADAAVRAAYLGDAAPQPRSPRILTAPPLLDVRSIEAGYGSLRVLTDVSLTVAQGEAVALLGPNGAGKSTLMKALSGLLRPVQGSIRLGDQALERLPAHRVAQAGLILVPEGRQVFPQLTVHENLVLGATRLRHLDSKRLYAVLARFPKLNELLDRRAALLSGGEQQMLAVARGLLAEPLILLLDEPSLGLAPALAAALFRDLGALAEEGMTLIVADQMAEQALAIADRSYVMNGGRLLDRSHAADIETEALSDIYFGGAVTEVPDTQVAT